MICAFGIQAVQHSHEPLVGGAFQNRIRKGADEDFGLFDVGVEQRIALADIAVNHPYLALHQSFARGAACADDLFQIDLKSDHEEEKNETELRDGGNAVGRGNQTRPGRAEGKAGDQISEQDRLAELLRDQAENPGGADAKRDVANEFVHGEEVRRKKGG